MLQRPLTKELIEKAKIELNETPKRKEDDVKHIKNWLLKQPYLNARQDDAWITNFLRGCKFSTQKAKETLEYLYTSKPMAPEFYSNRDPLLPEMQDILNRNLFLPYGTQNTEVMIVRWRNVDPNKICIANFFKIALMVLDINMFANPTMLILGIYVIVDLKDFPLTIVKQMTPSFMKKLCCIICKGYPVRIKGLYFINFFPYFNTLFNMFKPFMTKKMLSKVKFCKEHENESLLKNIPESALPKEYGGTGDTLSEIGERWKAIIESYREWLIEDEQYKSLEVLVLNNLNRSSIFGMEGSFRQLELD